MNLRQREPTVERRRYVPLDVRVRVAERQFDAATVFPYENGERLASVFRGLVDRAHWKGRAPLQEQLDMFLQLLFGGAKFELHHRPALVNRPLNRRKTDTVPAANDPEHLVYLLKDEEHRIETYVRGVGAQRSDVSQRRYLKKVARNRERTSDSRSNLRSAKRKWPSRPFPKARKIKGRR